MRHIGFGVAIVAALAMAGCTSTTKDNDATKSTSAPASAAASSPGASSPAASSPAAADDTKTACTTVNGDIQDALAKVADAEKIGPPAGYNAVSAQYSAGAAVLYSHTFNTSTKVNDAAKQAADAMSALADLWAKNPKDKPSTATLTTALDHLKTVCAAA